MDSGVWDAFHLLPLSTRESLAKAIVVSALLSYVSSQNTNPVFELKSTSGIISLSVYGVDAIPGTKCTCCELGRKRYLASLSVRHLQNTARSLVLPRLLGLIMVVNIRFAHLDNC